MSESSVFMGCNSMWEISPGQGVPRGIFRASRIDANAWDIPRMSEKPDIAMIRTAIEREMKAKGFSRRSLSSAAGLSQTAVRDLLDRTENPGIGTLHKIAEALEMPFETISGAAQVPMLGE